MYTKHLSINLKIGDSLENLSSRDDDIETGLEERFRGSYFGMGQDLMRGYTCWEALEQLSDWQLLK
jgi:hypothetical protein